MDVKVLWRLDFCVGVFHDFSRMNFGGNELMQGRSLTPQQVREMQKGFDLSTGDEILFRFVIAGADLVARRMRMRVL